MQPGEERRVLEGLLDERVHVLFERQVHPDADALHSLVCLRRPRPFVGGLHQTRAATRNDVAIHSTQRRAHLLDFLVNPVARLGARGSEHRHAIAVVPRWTQAAQVVDCRKSPKSVSTRMRLTASSSARLTVVGEWDGAVLMTWPS